MACVLLAFGRSPKKTNIQDISAKGSRALVVGRYSTCCTETRRGNARSLALVGKLFPTTDPNHSEPLRTANFITQQDLGGDYTSHINGVETRNAPDTRAWRRGSGVPILLVTGAVFLSVDKEPTVRQLYPIAELGKPKNVPTRTPKFMRLLVAPEQPRIDGEELDFRDEIMAQIFDKGDPSPKRAITFHIEVTDEGSTHGTPIFQRRTFSNWRPIGKLIFDNAVISYNGDFVIHFNHPTWRDDRNNASSARELAEGALILRWLRRRTSAQRQSAEVRKQMKRRIGVSAFGHKTCRVEERRRGPKGRNGFRNSSSGGQ